MTPVEELKWTISMVAPISFGVACVFAAISPRYGKLVAVALSMMFIPIALEIYPKLWMSAAFVLSISVPAFVGGLVGEGLRMRPFARVVVAVAVLCLCLLIAFFGLASEMD